MEGLKIQGVAMVAESPTLTKLAKSPSRLITEASVKVFTLVAVASEAVSKTAPPEKVIAPLIIAAFA